MVYRVIGLMSGSSLDGLDIAYAELDDSGGVWSYDIKVADCIEYDAYWVAKLKNATQLGGYEYLALHAEYGRYIAQQVNAFIHQNHLHHKVQLIASHGHTVFHAPEKGFTAQLGCGATIAAGTGVNVVSDLRAMDVALGGQGAPIVPVGEKLLWKGVDFFLNLGGIANISLHTSNAVTAFDVCPANRVLNLLAQLNGKAYDENGAMAATGVINPQLLAALNALGYYAQAYPKSLANDVGTHVVFPLIQAYKIATQDALRTYTTHIAQQIAKAAVLMQDHTGTETGQAARKMLVTGGGAFNVFLVERLAEILKPLNIDVVIPAHEVVKYKEAVVMGLLGVLRWREENTVLSSVTGATRNSIGGAVWIGQEA